MRPGYLNNGRTRMLFSTKDRWDTVPRADDILLRRLYQKTFPSFYCKNCNIIITKLEKDGEWLILLTVFITMIIIEAVYINEKVKE